MKPFLILGSLILSVCPALAHTGAHIHPHADDPTWIPVVIGLFVVTGAAAFAWYRK